MNRRLLSGLATGFVLAVLWGFVLYTGVVYAGNTPYATGFGSDPSAPDWGNWAWVTGTNFGGRTYYGNVHWWMNNFWIQSWHEIYHNRWKFFLRAELYNTGKDQGGGGTCDALKLDVRYDPRIPGSIPSQRSVRIKRFQHWADTALDSCSGDTNVYDMAALLVYRTSFIQQGGHVPQQGPGDRGYSWTVDAYTNKPSMPSNMEVNYSSGSRIHQQDPHVPTSPSRWLGKIYLCPNGTSGGWEDLSAEPTGLITNPGPC